MSKPKIAVIGLKGLPAYGGAATVGENIIEQLKHKFDFTVYAIDTHTNHDGKYKGIKQKVFKGSRFKRLNTFLYYIKSTFHALFKEDYDLIHIHHIYASFILPLLKTKYRIIITIHGIIPEDDNKWNYIDKLVFRFLEKCGLALSDKVTSVSKPDIVYLKNSYNRDIKYIPNGTDINVKNFEYEEEKKNVITFAAARIIGIKGCHIFLKALKALNYEGHVKIIGDLNQVPSYKNKIKKLAQGLNVTFTGLLKDKSKLFQHISNSRLFVFPSFKEGMSSMLLEVGSLKTPIVCSDIEENKVVFSDNEVQYFENGNVDSLANEISFALNNPEMMKMKAEKAFQKIQRDYNWDRIANEYSLLYQKLV